MPYKVLFLKMALMYSKRYGISFLTYLNDINNGGIVMKFADFYSKHKVICIFLIAILALIYTLILGIFAKIVLFEWKVSIHLHQGNGFLDAGDYERARSELEYVLPYVFPDQRREIENKIQICIDAMEKERNEAK